jgi:hypothetical protein
MPPLTASRHRYGLRTVSGCWPGITQGGATFSAEALIPLDGGAAFWAGCDKGCPATRTEFAPFPIFAAAFRTAHLSPPVLSIAQLVEQRLGVLQVGGIEALGEPVVDLREHDSRFVWTVLLRKKSCESRCSA